MREIELTCPAGHAWSVSTEAVQTAGGRVRCPVCGQPSIVASPDTPGAAALSTAIREQVTPHASPLTVTEVFSDREGPSNEFGSDPRSDGPRPMPPSPQGYEILGEIGRGGMGVVYKARQMGLGRIVALKMLVAGQHAGPAKRARFQTEAEAVARLQHPNIVQIHEVGHWQGHAFFSLEYVEGGSLADKLNGAPQPAAYAATLIATLAAAVEFAHARGIIHRDLKPANVLLAADGAPKITDFGLAKQLQAESSQTHTGDIMGTPSYMAPEQAGGVTKSIGPPCDIYALGAMLYELLTGRPPFRGQDAMETILLTLTEEPVAPRRLAFRTPRDLETICLKCLEKTPRKRYASAAALAEDCNRFLNGQPILARPVRPWERAIKWARRRPAAAALIAVSLLALTVLLSYGAWKNAQLSEALAITQQQRERSENNFLLALDAADRRLNRAGQDEQHVLEEELAFFDQIRRQPGDDAGARYEKALASLRAGDVLRMLARATDAEAAYAEAIALLSALAEGNPQTMIYRRQLAAAHNNYAELKKMTGDIAAAEAEHAQALRLLEQLQAESPDDADYAQMQAVQLNNLGVLMSEQDRAEDAEQAQLRAARLRRELVKYDPQNTTYQHDLAVTLNNLGALYRRMKRFEDSRAALQESLDLREALPAADRADANFRRALAGTYVNLGATLGSLNRADESEAAYRQAIDMLASLVRHYPDAPLYQQKLAETHSNLGLLLAAHGKYAAAAVAFRDSEKLFQALSEEYPETAVYRDELARMRENLEALEEALPPAGETTRS